MKSSKIIFKKHALKIIAIILILFMISYHEEEQISSLFRFDANPFIFTK
jgi:hypothetical protein